MERMISSFNSKCSSVEGVLLGNIATRAKPPTSASFVNDALNDPFAKRRDGLRWVVSHWRRHDRTIRHVEVSISEGFAEVVHHAVGGRRSNWAATERMGRNGCVGQLKNDPAAGLLGQRPVHFLDAIEDLSRPAGAPIQSQNIRAK